MCPDKFQLKGQLAKHYVQSHSTYEKFYVVPKRNRHNENYCVNCGYWFTSEKSFFNHVLKKHGDSGGIILNLDHPRCQSMEIIEVGQNKKESKVNFYNAYNILEVFYAFFHIVI